MTTNNKPPVWYWIVAVLALLWNSLGVMAYLMQVMMPPEALDLLPEAERALYENVPAWVTGAFAIAVFGGALGSLALILKKGIAHPLFVVSFLAIIVQMTYNVFLSKALEVYGPGGLAMPIMTFAIGLSLIFIAKSAKTRGWIS
jgi:hypothetical protein